MKNFINNRKKALLSGVITIVLLATAGVTLAYLTDKTGVVDNTFTPTEVTCEVIEPNWNDGDTKKESVSIKNTGNIDAYIRVALVFNWVAEDEQGNQYIAPEPVEQNDYIFDKPVGWKWLEGSDGYYYYPDIVPAKGLTEPLVALIRPSAGAAPEGYTLSVEVVADAIQAEGGSEVGNPAVWTPAVTQAWGVNVVDGKLSVQ